VRCTWLLLGVKRTSAFALQMSAFDLGNQLWKTPSEFTSIPHIVATKAHIRWNAAANDIASSYVGTVPNHRCGSRALRMLPIFFRRLRIVRATGSAHGKSEIRHIAAP
jgi:hypothetical protein